MLKKDQKSKSKSKSKFEPPKLLVRGPVKGQIKTVFDSFQVEAENLVQTLAQAQVLVKTLDKDKDKDLIKSLAKIIDQAQVQAQIQVRVTQAKAGITQSFSTPKRPVIPNKI